MKKVIIASLMASAISAPAFAETGNGLADASLIFNMDNSHSMELAVLSMDEMKSTEGAWWDRAIGGGLGALGGHYGYFSGAAFGRSYSFTGHMSAIGWGAVTGIFSPVRGVQSGAQALGLGTFGGGLQGWAGSQGTTFRW